MGSTRAKCRIFIVTYGGAHVDIVLRLLPYLDAMADVELQVMALTTAAPRLEQTDWKFKRCLDYLPLPGYEQAMSLGDQLSNNLGGGDSAGKWDPSLGIDWDESCAYLGVSMTDLIAEIGEDKARENYETFGRGAFCPRAFMRHVFEKEQPDLVLTSCLTRMERAAIMVAREVGAVSVLIENLMGRSLLDRFKPDRPPQLAPQSEWPDHFIVPNTEISKRVQGYGFPADRVHALGQPVLSEWQEDFDKSAPSPALADWVKEQRTIITNATTPWREMAYDQSDALLKVARSRPDWRFCFKLHPSVGKGEILQHYPDLPPNVRIIAGEDILPVVRASSLVIIHASTVGVLCLSGGIPLLILDYPDRPQALPYVESGSARGLTDFDALEDVLVEMLEAKAAGKNPEISPVFDHPTGASERIAKWIGNLCRDS